MVDMLLYLTFGAIYFTTCLTGHISANHKSKRSTEDVDDVYFPSLNNHSVEFDWRLIKAVALNNEKSNVLISPISLKIVLALLYEGASGGTKKEFQSVLRFPENPNLLRQQYEDILSALQAPEDNEYRINLGTRIFLDSHIHPQQNYAAKIFHSYNTNITSTNFTDQVGSSKIINSWVDTVTNGHVKALVKSDDLQDAVLVMANALLFKGRWLHQFPKNLTETRGFYLNPNEVVQAQFMTTSGHYYFYNSKVLDAKILRLPYKGSKLGMFIILPNAKLGLRNLLQNINDQNLRQELYNLEPVEVLVTLPKFKFGYDARFTKVLQEFGLLQMFQNTASFPGIARGTPSIAKRLMVSDVIQKSGIEVDEEGSIIFSATDIQLTNKFGEAENTFNASHPFLFIVEEHSTGAILFMGKVQNPLEVDSPPIPSRFAEEYEDTASGQLNSPNLQPVLGLNAPDPKRFSYFDLELLHELSDHNDNFFVSPASIKTTLAMILEGAQGKCAEEIQNALRLPLDRQNSRNQLQQLLYDLTDTGSGTVLESANSIFVSDKLDIVDDYERILKENYNAGIRSTDFSKPQQAANVVNNWVSNATHGLIPDIVTPDSFPEEKSALILNAIYFKGQWKRMFTEKYTSLKCFTTPSGQCANVPMMQVVDTFNYKNLPYLDAQAVVLPYNDNRFAMLILLPSEKSSVRTLTRDLQHDRFISILEQLEPTELSVEIPRFEIDYNTGLEDYLKQLKIREIFLPTANLSIVEQQNVKISNIIHKTHIEVNEKGTVAAAATGAVVIPLMGSSMPRFIANRPFVFFIYHVKTGNILFEGQYSQPQEILNTATPLRSRSFGQPLKTVPASYNPRQRSYPQRTQYNYNYNYQ